MNPAAHRVYYFPETKLKSVMKKLFLVLAMAWGTFGVSLAQNKFYNTSAGTNAPMMEMRDSNGDVLKDERGNVRYKEVQKDNYGNAQGNKYDLAVDGAFDGQTIAVLHLYTGEGFDFSLPKEALKEKGFSVYRWLNYPPPAKELEKALEKACQLWIISDYTRKLDEEHLKVIKKYFDAGHGVYIWGDNDPYYADANAVADYLFGGTMSGNLYGDQTVGLQQDLTGTGLKRGHLITTGLENVYEGITIATIADNKNLEPILYGSANNVVASVYERDGKRAILDGGFTRLYVKWETAGTGRYVKNAAAWLVNVERFGDDLGKLK